MNIREDARTIPVLAEYDVVVCGGGPAGCAAAIASARTGARTLLVEREGFLGGATVAQLVIPILSTNGMDFQGVWHEFIRAARARNGVSGMSRQDSQATPRRRGAIHFSVGSLDPEAVKYAWDDLLSAAGAEQLLHAICVGAIVEDGCIAGVVLETKAGRVAIRAGRVVDCSGDAEVCDRAGIAWEQGAFGVPWAMAVSRVGRVGNVPVDPGDVAGQFGQGLGRSSGPNRSVRFFGMFHGHRVDPLDPWSLTRYERETRQTAWDRIEQMRRRPGLEGVYLVETARAPGVRSSRRVRGIYRMTADDVWNLRKHEEGIARASWEVDVHCPIADCDCEDESKCPFDHTCRWDSPDFVRFREGIWRGEWYDVRYGALVAAGVDNLLVAGRCISGEHLAQASYRIQQTCMALGQAAGTAAAMSIDCGATPRELDVSSLAGRLARDRDVEPAFDVLRNLPTRMDAPKETRS